MRFVATELTDDERALQQEVRYFLDAELPPGSFDPGLGMASGVSKELSRKLGERGWLGMALPEGVRRRRAQCGRALRGGRGAVAAGRAARGALDRRPSERPGHQPLRLRGAEAALPPCDLSRRADVLDRHERARRGKRPRFGGVPGHQDRRRLRAVGHEDLDEQRALRRLRDRAVPHERRRGSSLRLEPARGRPALAGCHRQPDPVPRRHRATSTRWCSTASSCPKTCCSAARVRGGRRTRRSSASSAPGRSGGSRRSSWSSSSSASTPTSSGPEAVRFLGDVGRALVGYPAGVAHRGAHDRRREAAVGRVRARQGPRHAVRAGGDGAHPDVGRRRAVTRVRRRRSSGCSRARCSWRRRGRCAAAPTRSCAA